MSATGAVCARIRVAIVDDHPVLREGLATIISREPDMSLAGEAGNGKEALALLRRDSPEVVLLDLSLPDMHGLDLIAAARNDAPLVRFVILTIYGGEDDIFNAVKAGARAYLLKDARAEEMLCAIREVHRGNRYLPPTVADRLARRMTGANLTARELDVLELLVTGDGNKAIASRLGIGEGTVKSHVNNILVKLGAETRSHAIVAAIRRGLVR